MQDTAVCLWFDGTAVDAARFYTSIVQDGKLDPTFDAPEGMPYNEAGTPILVEFSLNGQRFTALNGGPHYQLTPAASIVLTVDTQEEVDRLWAALTADGGEESQCGWLVDKFGLSWQIIPRRMHELMQTCPPDAAERVTKAMLQMRKLDIAALEAAARG